MKAIIFTFLLFLPASEVLASQGSFSLSGFFSDVIHFFTVGIYEWAEDVLERVGDWFIIWSLKLMTALLDIAKFIVDSILSAFNISGTINQLLGDVNSSVLNIVVWLRIPDAISMMLSAQVVRLIISLFI